MLALVGSGLYHESGGRFTRKPTRASLLENPMNTFNLYQALTSVEGLRAAFSDCKNSSPFDAIRQIRADGSEFWSARDLQGLLGYAKWERFSETIERAKCAARNAGVARVDDQFPSTGKMVDLGSGSQRIVNDFHLSRYASYLVAMNGDPSKPEIAAAQHYFAVQTREAEMGRGAPLDMDLQILQYEKRVSFLEGLVEGLQGRGVTKRDSPSQPRTNRAQPVPTYGKAGDATLPRKLAPWTHPKIAAAQADILAMATPVSMDEVFAMLKEEHEVPRNRTNEMAVAYILKGAGRLRRKQSRRPGQMWVYDRVA